MRCAVESWEDSGPVFGWQEGPHLCRADKWAQGEKAEGAKKRQASRSSRMESKL